MPTKNVIADTKYKIVYSDESDPKNGISQSDLYQMLAYTVRFDIDEIVLFYPGTINSKQMHSGEIVIEDALAGGKEVHFKVFQLPILNWEMFAEDLDGSVDLKKMFKETQEELAERIRVIFELKSKNNLKEQ